MPRILAALNPRSPHHFTRVITDPPKPPLVTPFDDLLLAADGKPITKPRQWQQKRTAILKAFQSTLGTPPATRPAPEGRVIARSRGEGFERQKLEIRVHPDEVATAYLCLPKKPLPGNPAVLCLPETDVIAHEKIAGLHGMGPNAYGARLAAAGFVTLCPNHFTAGERTPKHGPFVTAEFYEKYPAWSAVGKAIWDYRICLDFLETVSEVNAARIGCMGHSLGAHGSVFLASQDERIRCAVSNCGLNSFRCNPDRCHWSRDGWYIYFPTLRERFLRGEPAPFDFHELGATLAPRAWLDISGVNDPTFQGGEHLPGMFTRIHEVYALLGAADKFAFYTHGAAHSLPEHSYALAEAWLKTWLVS